MDDSKIKKGDDSFDGQTTIISDRDKLDSDERTMALDKKERIPNEKSSSSFDIEDITKKLKNEIADIPEVEMDDMDSGQLSGIIKNVFPQKTQAELLKINRHFLRDAEPFSLERLVEDMEKRPDGVFTGISCLDRSFSIPTGALTVITSGPRHGKSVFMMNLLLNMAHKYKDKHFLFYTYEEVRRETEIKLINISGDIPFAETGNATTNTACWKNKLRTMKADELTGLSHSNSEYSGLARFADVAPRIHIIDRNYEVAELADSIRSFDNTFEIGAVFVDFLQRIKVDKRRSSFPRGQQMQDISESLRETADITKLPIICGAQFSAVEKGIPEYDVLSAENIKEIWNLEWAANLIIGLQDYSRSKFIGSNINDNFKSKLFEHKLMKPEKIQGSFNNKDSNSIILLKVLVNKEGLEPEEELLFYKTLLKIRDLQDNDIRLLRKNLT